MFHRSLAFLPAFTTALAFLSVLSSSPAPAAEPAQPSAPAPQPVASSVLLTDAAAAFQSHPDDVTWAEFSRAFKAALSDSALGKVDAATLMKANPLLAALGARVLDTGYGRLWLFPRVSQSREAFVQWQDTRSAAAAAQRSPVPVSAWRVQGLPLSPQQLVKEAKVLSLTASTDSGAAAVKPRADTARYLFLVGEDQTGKGMWLKSYRLGGDGWRENSEPLSAIPPFLFTAFAGTISFSGQDLVLSISPRPDPAAQPATGGGAPLKLALRLVNGKYALDGKAIEDTPYNTVHQFVGSLLQGRTDLARAWLMDGRLISIPKYLGLTTKAPGGQFRIVNMPGPQPAVHRFRVVTFDKDDLIVDVARSKTLWAIKAIFIAPSDPSLQKIVGMLPENQAASTGNPAAGAGATNGAPTSAAVSAAKAAPPSQGGANKAASSVSR